MGRTTENNTLPPATSAANQLPIIIAGAGPCGLTTALTLQRHGIPFTIYERANREKLCSNAGSGIDMAPTAVDILENKLKVNMDKAMRPYEYMYMADMKGRPITTYRLAELQEQSKITDTRTFGFACRADLQRALLDCLEDETAVLKCGVQVMGYTQSKASVEVSLSDGMTVKGSALLACDGIHSAVRKQMYSPENDKLHYCGQECWWGKTTVKPGSKLDQQLKEMDKVNSMQGGNVALAFLGTHGRPGCFFSCEIDENLHAWVWVVHNKEPPNANATNDLTRRGGSILTPEDKQRELSELVANRADVLKCILEETPAEDITRAGLFDRENLNLPYTDGRVALLGDAAHPQSPMMGQGANMAIVDGYVVATRLAVSKMLDIPQTLANYDTKSRRKANNSVIKEARKWGKMVVSQNRFTCWAFRIMTKYMPAQMMIKELIKGDESNVQFVSTMNKELGKVGA